MQTEIVTALITGGFAVIVAMIEFTRRQNNKDHGRNADKLDDLARSHRRVEEKVDTLQDNHLQHIRDHAKGDLL